MQLFPLLYFFFCFSLLLNNLWMWKPDWSISDALLLFYLFFFYFFRKIYFTRWRDNNYYTKAEKLTVSILFGILFKFFFVITILNEADWCSQVSGVAVWWCSCRGCSADCSLQFLRERRSLVMSVSTTFPGSQLNCPSLVVGYKISSRVGESRLLSPFPIVLLMIVLWCVGSQNKKNNQILLVSTKAQIVQFFFLSHTFTTFTVISLKTVLVEPCP